MLIFGERHLRRVLAEYTAHYNTQRPHRALQLRPPRPELPVPEPVLGKSVVDQSSEGRSTSTNPQPETPDQTPWQSSGTPQGGCTNRAGRAHAPAEADQPCPGPAETPPAQTRMSGTPRPGGDQQGQMTWRDHQARDEQNAVLITGPGDATVDATPARSHGYPRLLDMRRAVREQVQPAAPGDDHTPTRPGYTGPPRSDDDRGQPRSVYRRPPRSGRPEAACRQGEEGIEALAAPPRASHWGTASGCSGCPSPCSVCGAARLWAGCSIRCTVGVGSAAAGAVVGER